jgi:hypothetical protein
MRRTFCDLCGKEITGDSIELERTKTFTYTDTRDDNGPHQVVVSTSYTVDGGSNSSDVCTECIQKVVEYGLPGTRIGTTRST